MSYENNNVFEELRDLCTQVGDSKLAT